MFQSRIRLKRTLTFATVIVIFLLTSSESGASSDKSFIGRKILYAINAGAEWSSVDSDGIEYAPDPYAGTKTGVASDYGTRYLTIGRTKASQDAFLYQTERYGLSDFEYQIPIKHDGDFVLVLKFCEVYFLNPGRKIFDVTFNNHLIIKDLDIFDKVGHATAYDEIIPFRVTDKGKTLHIGEETSTIVKGQVPLTFIKGKFDNPKINAFYVIRGTIEDVPEFPPIDMDNPYEEFEEEDEELSLYDENQETSHSHHSMRRKRHFSPPPTQRYNPYDRDENYTWSTVVPICAAVLICIATFMAVRMILGKATD